MQVAKLYKAVAETGATHFQVNDGDILSIESKEYQERKDHFIKGGYTIEEDPMRGRKILRCAKIEKDVTITLNRIKAINGVPVDEVAEEMDSLISAVFFDKKTLEMAGKEIRIRDILPYSEACVESFKKRYPDREIDLNDFAVVTIDWSKKNIQIRPV